MTNTLLVTGGLGFIGSRFIRHWLAAHPSDRIINIDSVTYAADAARLSGLPPADYEHVAADIADRSAVTPHLTEADYVVHFAAESHVDRSIHDASPFIATNIAGTHALLELVRDSDVRRFHHVSTDEVFGMLALDENRRFNEESPYAPRSPYAASKAAADHLVRAYGETYGLAYTITNGSNNYGPYQHPEKFIPRLVTNALRGRPLPVYGSGNNVRDWLHVDDYCAAISTVLLNGETGRTYCVGGDAEHRNLDVARAIADLTGVGPEAIEFVQDRPGHDVRYAIDGSRIRDELQWYPSHDFTTGLAATVDWYRANPNWWAGLSNASEEAYQSITRPVKEVS